MERKTLLEIWKNVVGYQGRYIVSGTGEIRSLCRKGMPRRISTRFDQHGYLVVSIMNNGKRKTVKVHRIVAMAFCEGRSRFKKYVNHKNGVKTDNSIENLEWCTPSHNVRHALKIGLTKPLRGELNPAAKLKPSDIPIIRKMADDKISRKDIAAKFGVSPSAITFITLRKKMGSH
jgi:hypothetical protein